MHETVRNFFASPVGSTISDAIFGSVITRLHDSQTSVVLMATGFRDEHPATRARPTRSGTPVLMMTLPDETEIGHETDIRRPLRVLVPNRVALRPVVDENRSSDRRFNRQLRLIALEDEP